MKANKKMIALGILIITLMLLYVYPIIYMKYYANKFIFIKYSQIPYSIKSCFDEYYKDSLNKWKLIDLQYQNKIKDSLKFYNMENIYLSNKANYSIKRNYIDIGYPYSISYLDKKYIVFQYTPHLWLNSDFEYILLPEHTNVFIYNTQSGVKINQYVFIGRVSTSIYNDCLYLSCISTANNEYKGINYYGKISLK